MTVTEVDVRAYLDTVIRFWRETKAQSTNDHERAIAGYYIDAYQSARVSLFGDKLPSEEVMHEL